MAKFKVSATKTVSASRPKVQLTRVRLARERRTQLIQQIMKTAELSASVQNEAEQLARRTQAAKSAPFLDRYRVTA